jgi:hypothetical protein
MRKTALAMPEAVDSDHVLAEHVVEIPLDDFSHALAGVKKVCLVVVTEFGTELHHLFEGFHGILFHATQQRGKSLVLG